MALYYELPVYKLAYDTLLIVFRVTKNFNKEYKYTIGEKLKNESIDMMTQIFKANIAKEKKEHLKKAREGVEVFRLLLRLLKDLKEIDLKTFVDLNKKIEELSKQFVGWQKASA